MKNLGWLVILASALTTAAPVDNTVSLVKKPEELRKDLGTDKFSETSYLKELPVAVIDNGFKDAKARPYLPDSAELVADYDEEMVQKCGFNFKDKPMAMDPNALHGRWMAQALWAASGGFASGPKMYLLNGNGLDNFARAVCFAIHKGVKIILHAQTRESVGNMDGTGPVNEIVDLAVKRGIIFINAAGNNGNHVHSAPLRVDRDGFVVFANDKKSLRFKSLLSENKLNITLNYNRWGFKEEEGTDLDLNLYVYREKDWKDDGLPFAKGVKKQIPGTLVRNVENNESYLPRERIPEKDSMPIDFGDEDYRIFVKHVGGEIRPKDRIWITIKPDFEKGDAVYFPDATPGKDLLTPADHEHVNFFAVGDTGEWTSRGVSRSGHTKPDVLLNSSAVLFTSSLRPQVGSSFAAALFAGMVTTMMAHRSDLDGELLRVLIKNTKLGNRMTDGTPKDVELGYTDQVRNEFKEVAGELGKIGAPMEIGGIRLDGLYVIGITISPHTLTKMFDPLPQGARPDEYEYYAFNYYKEDRSVGITGHWRKKQMSAEEKAEPFPWETKGIDKKYYVEIRQAKKRPDVFRMCTPEELKAAKPRQ